MQFTNTRNTLLLAEDINKKRKKMRIFYFVFFEKLNNDTYDDFESPLHGLRRATSSSLRFPLYAHYIPVYEIKVFFLLSYLFDLTKYIFFSRIVDSSASVDDVM